MNLYNVYFVSKGTGPETVQVEAQNSAGAKAQVEARYPGAYNIIQNQLPSLGPFRQAPVASLIYAANARRAATRAGLRCSLIGLCSWNEAPCANLTWNSIIPSSSSGAPISNPREPAEPFSGHNRKSCASLPSQQARVASQPYAHNDPSSAGGSPGYREGPSPLL
jgi:hypothetical protein